MKKIMMLFVISIGLLLGATNESNAFGFGFCSSGCNKATCVHKDIFEKCKDKCKASEIKNCTTSFCKYGCTAKNCLDKDTYLLCNKACNTKANKDNIKNCKGATGAKNRNAGRRESKARNEERRAKKAKKQEEEGEGEGEGGDEAPKSDDE